MNIKDTLLASLVPIFLGFGFVIAKPAMESFPPILLMGLRFTFAASILIWWFPIPRGYLKKIFIASLIAVTLTIQHHLYRFKFNRCFSSCVACSN